MALRPLSHIEQVANHLRAELQHGRWVGELPGVFKLERELGINHGTLQLALRQLEREGILKNQGRGRRRRIVMPSKEAAKLRIRILPYEPSDRMLHYVLELVHLLQQAGHEAAFADKAICDLGMKVERIARFVGSTEADAWVVLGGPRDLLDWFATQPMPAFALFGRAVHVPLAGISPRKAGVYKEVVKRLVDVGHRRIILLVRKERRKPSPGFLEQVFLDGLEKHGIRTGAYHLPDWDESATGIRDLLESLFRHSPPTAMIIGGASLFSAIRAQLAQRGILSPKHVSLICGDPDPVFEWDLPAVTHITWDYRPMIRRVVRWADNISRGKDDRRKSVVEAKLVLGGTMGPVPKFRR